MLCQDTIYIKVRQTMCAVRLDDILYMEKQYRQIIIHVADGEDVCFYGKYDDVMPLLDSRFVHPHESYVINMQHIQRLGNHEAVMFGGDRIVMGTRCFGKLRKAYDDYITENISSWPGMRPKKDR